MPGQIDGYYSTRRDHLLADFDRLLALATPWTVTRFGKEFSSMLQSDARGEYTRLIPDIPYLQGFRARALNQFLLGTAQEVAVYKAMKKHGRSTGEAWELCHHTIRLRMAEVPKWKIRMYRRFMFSRLAKKIVSRRAHRQERGHFGDFEIEYIAGDGDAFDFGVNYLQCGNLVFARKQGCEEFAPYVCMSDIALSDAMGWGLIRTQTLADGCPHCDFRFKKGANTRISSKTPAVQDTIEMIYRKEAYAGEAGNG